MNRLILIFCLILPLAGNANAQQREYTGGMNHTYLRKAPAPATTEAIEDTTAASEEEPTPKDTVWKKYMALASGTAEETTKETGDETTTAPQSPDKPSKPQPSAQEQAPAPKATGFAAILQNYQTTKTQRSQMKSIQMNKPTVEKPVVDAPKAVTTTQ